MLKWVYYNVVVMISQSSNFFGCFEKQVGFCSMVVYVVMKLSDQWVYYNVVVMISQSFIFFGFFEKKVRFCSMVVYALIKLNAKMGIL